MCSREPCSIKENFLVKFSKCGILNTVINLIRLKEQAILKKTDGKKVNSIKGIPKLDDANKAGTKDSHLCKLIFKLHIFSSIFKSHILSLIFNLSRAS